MCMYSLHVDPMCRLFHQIQSAHDQYYIVCVLIHCSSTALILIHCCPWSWDDNETCLLSVYHLSISIYIAWNKMDSFDTVVRCNLSTSSSLVDGILNRNDRSNSMDDQ
eukprot:201841_1